MAQQKVSFKKWWKNITGAKPDKATVGLFNIDLVDSIDYAGVPVSYTVGTQTRCQGYIPTIVAKCGWLLKEQAMRTRGIFRVSGSAKRVAELQLIFDTPPNYGSQLDWTGYTIHDASNVLRRYLNHLPDPVITLESYEKFRDVHRNMTDEEDMIAAYQDLIMKLPDPHSCLLMYLLDLLALFAHHSAENLMDSKNLASVFQPGVLSHPNHAMSPGEYMTSASVLKFLIDHQSSFTFPKSNYDEDDEEIVSCGPNGPGVQNFPNHQRQSIGSGLHGGYVSAEDHERLYDSMTGKSAGLGHDDGLRALDSGIRRQLSLQKPIIPHSTLPGHAPQRSKSTNSSTSSHRSHQSHIFSPTFLSKRRSIRNSKTGSKIGHDFDLHPSGEHSPKEQDLADIAEAATLERSSTPRSALIRKSQTVHLPSDDPNTDFSNYISRRKQLQNEGLRREPSIFCQTIEIQFPAPFVGADQTAAFKPSPPVSLRTIPGTPSDPRLSQTLPEDLGFAPKISTTAHVHIPDSPDRSHEGGIVPQTLNPRGGATLKRSSGLAPGLQSPNTGAILRAKSNPGELTHISSRSQYRAGASGSQGGGGHHTMEKFKGLFTGRHKELDPNTVEKDQESKRDMKRESLTERQRKYKSQEVARSQPSSDQIGGSESWRGAPVFDRVDGGGDNRSYYTQPPPPVPHHQQLSSIPPRPRPPPPENSLMDLLETPQRMGRQSGHSTPTGGSRSGSPSASVVHSAYPRHQLSTNSSFASSSSARSTPTGERLYHGRGASNQGSSGSLEAMFSSGHGGDITPPNRYSYRSSNDQTYQEDYSRQRQQQHPGHLTPHGSFRQNSFVSHGGGSSEALVPPSSSTSRSRNGSFGSMDAYDASIPPIAPKSRDRRAAREGSTSSLRGDVTPPRTRSNSSRNPSPVPSPSLGPLSSSHFQGQPPQQHYQLPGSSPLAGRSQILSPGSAGGFGTTLASTPSARARARAQSREDILRQESNPNLNNGRGYDHNSRPLGSPSAATRSLRSGSMTRSAVPTMSSVSTSSATSNYPPQS